MKGFMKGSGIALIGGGALLILINVILTPLLPSNQSEAIVRTSAVYLVRLSLSGVSAMLLLFGCIGVHLAQQSVSGFFGAVAFLVAFIGTSLLVAVEWSNVFVLPALAQTTPAALSALDQAPLLNIGFVSAAGLFALGWLLLAVSVWRAQFFARWVPVTVLAGLILIPVLSATPLGVAGAIAGNIVFGIGLVGLGRGVAKAGSSVTLY